MEHENEGHLKTNLRFQMKNWIGCGVINHDRDKRTDLEVCMQRARYQERKLRYQWDLHMEQPSEQIDLPSNAQERPGLVIPTEESCAQRQRSVLGMKRAAMKGVQYEHIWRWPEEAS